MDERLFSLNPADRIKSAESLEKEEKDQLLMKPYRPGNVRDRGRCQCMGCGGRAELRCKEEEEKSIPMVAVVLR